jgi:lantibiotic modifying enzyme
LQWPCGAPGGAETPNLMLGLAGIGYFYLRLYDPIHTPSLLMVIP